MIVASIAGSMVLVLLLDVVLKGQIDQKDLLIGLIIPLILAPLLIGSVISLLQQLQDAQVALQNLANTDLLTGLVNRRQFMEIADREWQRTVRYGGKLSLLMLDVDHFKSVNDTYGHAVGDLALQHVARICANASRGTDVVARYGGEEFVALLLEADDQLTITAAERIRVCLERSPLITDHLTIPLTVSIGIAWNAPQLDAFAELVSAADAALYASKRGGRNRVTAFSALEPTPI